MQGEMAVDYFARIGRRGEWAKAGNCREVAWPALPPEQRAFIGHRRAVLNHQRRTTRVKSWLEL